MAVKVEVKGLKEIEDALKALPEAASKRLSRAALRQASKPMAEKAKTLAPVKTGKLRDSIKIGAKVNGRQMKIYRRLSERHGVELFIGPSYLKSDMGRHGHLVEFGTKPRINGGKFKGTKHPGTRPQPFMRPAFDAEAQPTVERLKPLLWKNIQRAAKKHGKG